RGPVGSRGRARGPPRHASRVPSGSLAALRLGMMTDVPTTSQVKPPRPNNANWVSSGAAQNPARARYPRTHGEQLKATRAAKRHARHAPARQATAPITTKPPNAIMPTGNSHGAPAHSRPATELT